MERSIVNLSAGGRGPALARMIFPSRPAIRQASSDRALPFLDAN